MATKDWEIKRDSTGRGQKTIRFTDDELDRLQPVIERIAKRDNNQAKTTLNKVLKEFMGLVTLGIVTPQDRQDIGGNSGQTGNGDNGGGGTPEQPDNPRPQIMRIKSSSSKLPLVSAKTETVKKRKRKEG